MSPDRDEPGLFGRRLDFGFDGDDDEDEGPRSVFASSWVRAVLAVLVLSVLGVAALPSILDWWFGPLSSVALTTPVSQPAATTASTSSPHLTSTPSGEPGAIAQRSTPVDARESVAASPPASSPANPSEGASVVAASPRERRPVTSGGGYSVQVGAFKDPRLAAALAEKLRAENFEVQQVSGGAARPSSSSTPPPERYEVFVSGASARDVRTKLEALGFSADGVAGGVVVRPSLPLSEAIRLSTTMTASGLSVQVRRARELPAPSDARVDDTAGTPLHRVRVGPFADRAAAEEAKTSLLAKGYTAFVARNVD